MYRVLKKNGVIVWTTPINNVKFVKVFLASWRNILNLKYYKRLYYGPLILGHALTIQKKGKEGVYHFYNKVLRVIIYISNYFHYKIKDLFRFGIKC